MTAPKPPSLPADLLPPDPHAPAPSLGDVSGSTTPGDRPIAQVFSTERRDPSWAPAIEEEIAERTTDVPAKLTTECRTEHCKLTVDGATADVTKTIALLEREDHLYGMSRHVVLSKPEQRPDGTLSLTLYVVFDDR